MNVVVAGTGYVGLVTGVCLADLGHTVTCVDTDEHKIEIMQAGQSPIYEDGLSELMAKNKSRLHYTTDYQSAYKDAEVIFIGVGTPEKKDGSANLKYVLEVSKQIAECVQQDCIIVMKSTVPIGTNDRVEAIMEENLTHPVHIEIASNPEFLSQGTAVYDTQHATRIVLGVKSEKAEAVLRKLYSTANIPMIVTDRVSAEMIKYASNDFLALKISYINEIANFCEIVGANIEDVALGMGMDARIGNRFLKAGIGYGGSCFPKDTKALHWLANYHDYELKTVKAAIEINESQKYKLIKKAWKYVDNFKGLTIAVLGLTFKPDTDDLREAPSLKNIPIFLDDGATVRVWDPIGFPNFQKIYPNEVTYCRTIEETITEADLCFIFTEWYDIIKFDINKYSQLMKNPIILDGRNCYRIKDFENAQVIYESIGRQTINHLTIDNK